MKRILFTAMFGLLTVSIPSSIAVAQKVLGTPRPDEKPFTLKDRVSGQTIENKGKISITK